MKEGRQAIERREIILNAVDTFIKIHDLWEADVYGPPQPSEKFERAVKLCTDICAGGDMPEDCRGLCGAVAKMGVEWIRYESGQMGGDHRPTKSFWDAVRDVKSERIGAVPFAPRVRESVAVLRTQGVSREQIARFNYGDPEWENGFGPFCGSRGEVNHEKIDEEERLNKLTPPQTLLPPGWIHPDDRNRKRTADENARTKLAQLQEELTRGKSTEDPLKLLREGQFANVVARECGLTLDEVHALANQNGIAVENTPNLAAMRAPQEPEINEAADRALQPGPATDEPVGESPEQQVARLFSQGFDKHQIADRLGLTPRKVEKLRMLARV